MFIISIERKTIPKQKDIEKCPFSLWRGSRFLKWVGAKNLELSLREQWTLYIRLTDTVQPKMPYTETSEILQMHNFESIR